MSSYKVLFMGDSLWAGPLNGPEAKYLDQSNVIPSPERVHAYWYIAWSRGYVTKPISIENQGVSGLTLNQLKTRLYEFLNCRGPDYVWDLVAMLCGSNNTVPGGTYSEDFLALLDLILFELKECQRVKHVLLGLLPPIGETENTKYVRRHVTASQSAYNQRIAYAAMARPDWVSTFDIGHLYADPTNLFGDGVHLNNKGHHLAAKGPLYTAMRKILE